MKKFLSYFLTFVIVFLLSSTGTIWLAKTANNSDDGALEIVPSGGGSTTSAEQTTFFNGILSNFENNQKFSVSGDVEIEYKEENVGLSIFADVDIQEVDNIKINAFLRTEIENRTVAVSFVFLDNTIYVSFNDVLVKAEIGDISKLGKILMSLIPSDQMDFDGEDILSMFEEKIPEIIGAINSPVEEELSNGETKNTIDIKDIAIAEIITNSDDVLKSAKVETYEILGIKAKLDLDINFDNTIEINNPESGVVKRNYLDLSHIFSIVSNMKNWKDISANLNVDANCEFGNFDFDIDVLLNLKENNYFAKIDSCSFENLENAFVKYVDGKAYVCVGDVKILISENLIDEAFTILKQLISQQIEKVDVEKIVGFVTSEIKNVDILNVFKILDKIQSLKLNDEGFVLKTDFGNLSIDFDENQISNILANVNVDGNKISVGLNVFETTEKVSSENDQEYFDIYEIAKKNLEFYKSTGFETLIDIEVLKNGEDVVKVDGSLSFDFNLPFVNTFVAVDFSGRRIELKVIYENEIAFVQIDNMFVKMSKDDFKQFLDDLGVSESDDFTQKLNDKISEFTEEFKNEIKDLFEETDFEKLKDKLKSIKSFKIDGSGIEVVVDLSKFGLVGTGKFVLDTENYIVRKIEFSDFGFDEISINGQVVVENNVAKVEEFDKEKYLDVYDLVKNVCALKDLNSAKLGIAFSSVLSNKRIELLGNFGFNLSNSFAFLNGELQIDNEFLNFDIKTLGDDVFAKLENIELKINLEWFESLIKNLVPNSNEISEKLSEAMKKMVPSDLSGFAIESLNSIKTIKINSSGMTIKLDGTIFGVDGDINLNIEIRNNKITAIELQNFKLGADKISFKIDIYYVNVKTQEIQTERYLDVEEFTNNLISLKDLNNATFDVDADVLFKGELFKLENTNIFFDIDNKFASVVGKLFFGTDEYTFDIYYENNDLYFIVNNIKLKVNLEFVQELLGKFGVEGNLNTEDLKTQISDKVSNITNKFDVKTLSIDLLKNIEELTINSGKIRVVVSKDLFGTKENIEIEITLSENQISKVEFNANVDDENKFDIYITFEQNTAEKRILTENYLDVEEFTNNLISLKDLNNATFDVDADVLFKGELFKLENTNIFFDINNKFASVVGKMIFGTDECTFDIYYENDDVYLIVNNIKLKVNLEFVQELLGKFGVEDNINIEEIKSQLTNKVSNITNKFDVKTLAIDLLKNIEELTINSGKIRVVVSKDLFGTKENIKIEITLSENQISRVEFNANVDDENRFDVDITFEQNTAEKRILIENYLDVETIYDQIISLEKEKNLNIFANLNVYKFVNSKFEKEYVLDLDFMKQIQTNGQLSINLLLEILNNNGKSISLDAILQNNELFASFNNLKLKLKTDEILNTVHTVLDMFGIENTKYDDVVLKVVNILKGQTIESQFATEIQEQISNSNLENINVDIEKLVKNILTATINKNEIRISLDCSSFGFDQTIEISIILNNGKISKISTGLIEFDDWAIDVELSLDNNQKQLEKVEDKDKEKYLDIAKFADVAKATYNTLENLAVSGEMDLYFKFGNETNLLRTKYGIKFDSENKTFEGYLKAEFKSVTLNLYYYDNTFFIDLGGFEDDANSRLQISVQFSEIGDVLQWVKDTFGFDFTGEFGEVEEMISGAKEFEASVEKIKELIFNLDLGFITKSIFDGDILDTLFDSQIEKSIFDITENGKHNLEVFFKGGVELYLKHGEMIDLVVFTTDKVQAIIYCEDFNEFEFIDISKQESGENSQNEKITFNSSTFISISAVEDFVEKVIETFTSSPFEFWATIGNYDEGTPTNKKIEVGFQDKYLLLNVQGLKVKIYQKNLALIVSYVLQAVGLDNGLISNITKIIDKNVEAPELDTSNFNALFSGIDLGNPLSILNNLKGISLRDGELQIVMNKDIFTSQDLSEQETTDMIISLKTGAQKLESASLQNFKFSGTEIDLNVEFNRNENETSPYGDYVDLSESADLVKALINTSKMKKFHIQGNVVLNIATDKFKAATIGVDVKVALDEDSNVVIEGQFTNYPLMWEVNGNTNYTNGPGLFLNPRMRTISFYYKNGEIILKTVDEKWGSYKEYTRITRITPSYLMSNLKYYMAWLLCFNDTWQNLINDAIDTSAQNKADAIANGTYDYSNILLGYSKNENNVHNLQLNLGKIAYNDDLGTLVLNIQTINNAETGNEDFIGELGLSMDMLNFITIKTDSENILKLVDISTPENVVVDESLFTDENKDKFRLDGEYAKTGNDEFSQISATTSNITLKFNNDQADQVLSGKVCEDLNLPVPTKVVDNGISRTTFKFIGWFDENGKKWTRTTFPRNDKTLYAYWEFSEIKCYKQVVLENNNGNGNSVSNVLEGETINVSALQDYEVDNIVNGEKISRTFFTFTGWKLGDKIVGTNYSFTVEENVTLVAVWTSETKQYFTVSFDTNGAGNKDSITKLDGESIHVSEILKQSQDNVGVEKIDYNFLGWFDGDVNLGKDFDLTVSRDMTLVAKFEDVHTPYVKVSFDSVSYVSKDGNTIESEVLILKGQKVSLTSLANRNENSEDVRIVWAFAGWLNNGTKVEGEIVVQENTTLVATWTKVKEVFKTSVSFKHGEDDVVTVSGFVGDQVSVSGTLIKSTTKYYLDKEFSTVCGFVSTSGENVVATIQETDVVVYVRNQFKISFDTNGGNTIDAVYVYEGEKITLQSTSKSKTGKYIEHSGFNKYKWEITTYTFIYWKDDNGTQYINEFVVGDSDITLKAEYNEKTETETVGVTKNNQYKNEFGG